MSPGTDAVLQSHEDRIQDLEGVCRKNSVEVASVVETVNGLGVQMETAFANLSEKMDQHNQGISKQLERLTASVDDHGERIEKLEDHCEEDALAKKKRADRYDLIRKGIWAVALTGIGALLREVVSFFLK